MRCTHLEAHNRVFGLKPKYSNYVVKPLNSDVGNMHMFFFLLLNTGVWNPKNVTMRD